MNRRLLGAVAAAALAFGFANAATAKTLVYCSEGSPENFNPQINTTGTSFDTAYPIFNRLVEFKPGTTEIMPGLAESWDVSDDGKVYTFHLRKGVKFHARGDFSPTREFGADAVGHICVNIASLLLARAAKDAEAALAVPLEVYNTWLLDGQRFIGGEHPSIADIRLAATLEFLRAIDYPFPDWAEDFMRAMEEALGDAYSEPAADVRGFIGSLAAQPA